ncbi:MAG TPA: TlpA disulfide reductase family protein [Pyrinomonadaceae bacterium]|jgi:thiol-disulfide isomerase/thioredoxin|nr:TlpA disulfide reductase family protein [Pyrinomonadaceae bacterium]
MRRYALTLLFALTLFVAAPRIVAAQSQTAGEPTTPDVSFKLKGLDGKTYDTEQMRGEVLLVSFGATWCAPCVWELAALEELKEEYKTKPVRFLWVSIEDEKQTSNAVLRHFAKSYRVTLPVLRDPSKEIFARFSNTVRLPLVVIIGPDGKFAAPAHRGMSSEPIQYKQLMRGRLNALLERSPKSESPTSKVER